MLGVSFFFFFQAEDGIRDADVTGVQTCALPICHHLVSIRAESPHLHAHGVHLELRMRKEQGFTLIEMMVSTAIMLLVLAGAMTAFKDALDINDAGGLIGD